MGVALLEASGKPFEIINLLENSLSPKELKEILNLIHIPAIDLVRKNEKVWKEKYKNGTYSDDELVKIMVENPKLIERPIIVNQKKAVIGRPTESINSIL